MRVLNKFSSLVVVGGIAVAAVLGGCSSGANTDGSTSGAAVSTQSDSVVSGDISGNWELSSYDDGSQSLDKDSLASYGYAYTLTVNSDGTLDLATLPGTWETVGKDTYTFTVTQATDSQSGQQSAAEPVVFNVSYKDGKLHLVTTGGIDWTFARATESAGQSGAESGQSGAQSR